MAKYSASIIIATFLILLLGCSSGSPTKSNVESAVTTMLNPYKLGGSFSVEGVQELPQQNAATADLKFDQFRFAVTNDGRIIEASKYKTPPDLSKRNPTAPLPSMEEMFPPRERSYSGRGTATIKRYNDGRLVVESISWGEYGLRGNVEIK